MNGIAAKLLLFSGAIHISGSVKARKASRPLAYLRTGGLGRAEVLA